MDTFKLRRQTINLEMTQDMEIYVDKARFRMVLENIIDNASKYSYEGGIIRVQVEQSSSEIYISITDNGVGIPINETKTLFSKFVRLNNPLSDKVGGSGLGLYWAKKIMQLHGGSIQVASKEGEGSKFTLVIPAGENG